MRIAWLLASRNRRYVTRAACDALAVGSGSEDTAGVDVDVDWLGLVPVGLGVDGVTDRLLITEDVPVVGVGAPALEHPATRLVSRTAAVASDARRDRQRMAMGSPPPSEAAGGSGVGRYAQTGSKR